MDTIFANMLPVFAAGCGGWILARRMPIDLRSLGCCVIYIIAPIVNFDAVMKAPATTAMVVLPLVAFIIGGTNSVLTYAWTRRALPASEACLTASSASSANTLYYGLGLAVALLPPPMLAAYLLAAIGLSVSESLFGYFFLARTGFSWQQALRRVSRLPVLYAVALGVVCRLAALENPAFLAPLAAYSRGALILIGSLILGVALGQERLQRLPLSLIGAIVVSRHLTFAALAGLLMWLDSLTGQLIAPRYHPLFLLFALMPIANNTLTFAATLELPTGRIGSAIILSNLLAFTAVCVLYLAIPNGWIFEP